MASPPLPPFCVNMTSLLPEMIFDTTDALVLSLLVVAFLVALVGNTTMLLILLRQLRQKRRRVFVLLLHMCVADLLTTVVSLPKEIVWTAAKAWHACDTLCRATKLFDVLGVYLSANVLVCISLDRFLSIFYPLYAIQARYSVRAMLGVAWTVSIVSSLPQLLLFRVAAHPCFPHYTQCISRDFLGEIDPHVSLLNTMLNAVEAYLLPFIVITFCYSAILIKIRREDNATASTNAVDVRRSPPPPTNGTPIDATIVNPGVANGVTADGQSGLLGTIRNGRRVMRYRLTSQSVSFAPDTEHVQEPPAAATIDKNKRRSWPKLRRSGGGNLGRARSKTLRMTIVMVAAFLVCWTPYFVMAFLHFVDVDYTTGKRRGRIQESRLTNKVLNVFACFNSSVNPYLYGFFSFDLRREVTLLLTSLRQGQLFAHRTPPTHAVERAANNHRLTTTLPPGGGTAPRPLALAYRTTTSKPTTVVANPAVDAIRMSPSASDDALDSSSFAVRQATSLASQSQRCEEKNGD